MSSVTFFLFGVLAGTIVTALTVLLIIARETKKLNEKYSDKQSEAESLSNKLEESLKLKLDNLSKDLDDTKYINEKLKEVAKYTEAQLEIMNAVQGPSTGPMFSKHRNSASHELKELERKKYTLLKSLIKEGHNPVINHVDFKDNVTEKLKLSDLIERMESVYASNKLMSELLDENVETPTGNKSDFKQDDNNNVRHLRLIPAENTDDTSPS